MSETKTTKDIKVNLKRSRKWGWGWSTTPTGHGLDIEAPSAPDCVGTYRQVCEEMQQERKTYLSGGVFSNTKWFYDGKLIVATYKIGLVEQAKDLPMPTCDCDNDPNYQGTCEHLEQWAEDDFRNHLFNEIYDYAWFTGFDPDGADDDGYIRIRVEV